MRTIAVMNQKGGVGKTTTSVNLSAALAAEGRRVCLIDLDPQAHASLHLGVQVEEGEESVYQLLVGQAALADVRRKVAENLWLVPAHIDLAATEMELASEVGRELILRGKLSADTMPLDYLIIDCPPSLGVLTLNALTTCNEVVLPLQPHFLALHGLSKLLSTLEAVSLRLNNRMRLTGVVLCMYESGTRLASEVSRDVEAFFAAQSGQSSPWANAVTFQSRIRRNIRLAEAPSFGQSIFEYAPTSNGAEDYRNLTREILGLPLEQKMPAAA